jgi:hypothetical protein
MSSIADSVLDRFCTYILPKIHNNVKSLILESVSMECILLAAYYPNLIELQLSNFNKQIFSRYFMGKIFDLLKKLAYKNIDMLADLTISMYFV